MRDVLYTKYNSLRKPEYQISTSIFLDDGIRYVEKKAIHSSAVEHVANIAKNSERVQNLYKDIKVLMGKPETGKITFPFLKGKSLLSDIDVKNDELEELVKKIKEILKKIHNYNLEYKVKFSMTEAFQNFFEGCEPAEEDAVTLANIDGIFGNFIEKEDGSIWCIDCEWVLDFPVPVRYMEFRSLLYFYVDNYTHLGNRIGEKEFIALFGYSEEDMALYTAMEEAFQQHVHGENRKYIYTENYKKTSATFQSVVDQLYIAQDQVRSMSAVIDEQQAYIEKIQRMMKNPLYALQAVGQKVKEKITGDK